MAAEIPAHFIQFAEQTWQYASTSLGAEVEAMRSDLESRQEATGIVDDSLSFALAWERVGTFAPAYISMLATAALIKLARAPRASNPLEHLEREMNQK